MPETLRTQPAPVQSEPPDSGVARLLQGLAFMAFWIALLFVSAGTIHWLRGWICAITYGVTMLTMGFIVSRINPALIPARSKWRRHDAKLFDKIILAIYLPLSILQPAIAALDAVRFRWSPMPFWTLYPGLAIFLFCVVLIGWAMAVNPWAEASVRIQSDRGHQVVHSGPYRFVRHPMYVGLILMYLSVALILGSNWALALAGIMAVILIVRTALEDRILQRELPGYREFTAVTRWRLLPGIW
jgi:protein-S-isoprenylcysteine O-methyltransferase Ste14